MSDEQPTTPPADAPPEDKGVVRRLAADVFTRHLQQAVTESRGQGTPMEVISASAMAYTNMLVMMVGKDAAMSLLRGMTEYVDQSSETVSGRA